MTLDAALVSILLLVESSSCLTTEGIDGAEVLEVAVVTALLALAEWVFATFRKMPGVAVVAQSPELAMMLVSE